MNYGCKKKIHEKDVIPVGIKNIYNISDMNTKPQDASTIAYLLELLDHFFENGRSPVAPNLDCIDDNNGLKPYLMMLLGVNCYHL